MTRMNLERQKDIYCQTIYKLDSSFYDYPKPSTNSPVKDTLETLY